MEMTVRLYTATATADGISFEVQASTDGDELYNVRLLWERTWCNRGLAWGIRVIGRFARVAHISMWHISRS
jgi:hypothetical protein